MEPKRGHNYGRLTTFSGKRISRGRWNDLSREAVLPLNSFPKNARLGLSYVPRPLTQNFGMYEAWPDIWIRLTEKLSGSEMGVCIERSDHMLLD